jgi:hypothetical protein
MLIILIREASIEDDDDHLLENCVLKYKSQIKRHQKINKNESKLSPSINNSIKRNKYQISSNDDGDQNGQNSILPTLQKQQFHFEFMKQKNKLFSNYEESINE